MPARAVASPVPTWKHTLTLACRAAVAQAVAPSGPPRDVITEAVRLFGASVGVDQSAAQLDRLLETARSHGLAALDVEDVVNVYGGRMLEAGYLYGLVLGAHLSPGAIDHLPMPTAATEGER